MNSVLMCDHLYVQLDIIGGDTFFTILVNMDFRLHSCYVFFLWTQVNHLLEFRKDENSEILAFDKYLEILAFDKNSEILGFDKDENLGRLPCF
jgi:hypothetical protein